MADQQALLASLLLGQKQRKDPLDAQRSFAQHQLSSGSSTAPLGSNNPLEGLARALQGGIGGWLARDADQQDTTRQQQTVAALGNALAAKTPEETNAALKGAPADADLLAPIYGQLLGQKMQDERTAQLGARAYRAAGGNVEPPSPQTITPQVGGARMFIQPAGLDNNLGNIRSTPLPWDGKGAPQNGFETFNTPQAGANAMAGNLASYAKANPSLTVAQAIAQWAPAADKNNPAAYTQSVAEKTGINPALPLSEVLANPVMAAQLMESMGGVEKGKSPASLGFSADTLVNAAAPKAAQFDPGAKLTQLGEQAAKAGDFATAVKYQNQAQEERVKFENARQTQAQTIAATGAEHDRQQATATPNNEQALSAGFADRMGRSNQIATQHGPALTQFGARMKEQLPFGVGNFNQSPEYQQAKQARDDFINAQLRRESGAAIAPSEYANADKQYFPQPGDAAEVIKQKEANRALALQGMVRNAGPTYTQPQAAAAPPSAAVERGPQPGAIEGGYRFKGGNPADQNNWERAQ